MALPRDHQPSLFGDSPADRAMDRVPPAPVHPDAAALARQLGPRVRLGTSSWSFPGWRGMVFSAKAPASELASHGLAAYAQQPLHRTVGLDRCFYETPSVETLRALAEQVPADFRFLVKAHQACTRPNLGADGTTLGSVAAARVSGGRNPRFLDGAWAADAVVGPLMEGLGDRCGPILFQFPALSFGAREIVPHESALADGLHAFLRALPRGPLYAVEFRNDALLRGPVVGALAAALRDHGARPAIGVIPSMPGPARAAQAWREAGWDPCRGTLVLRWLLGHGLGYDEARRVYEPFDRLAAPDPGIRSETAVLVAACVAAGGQAFVVINNKAEGSAPRSIPPLAESILAVAAKTPGPDRTTPCESTSRP